MKLYLINNYETFMASEKGITAMRHIPTDTMYYKSEILKEAEVKLPNGFAIKKTQCGEEIFKGDERAVMVTEKVNGKYVTSLITSAGVVELYEWEL